LALLPVDRLSGWWALVVVLKSTSRGGSLVLIIRIRNVLNDRITSAKELVVDEGFCIRVDEFPNTAVVCQLVDFLANLLKDIFRSSPLFRKPSEVVSDEMDVFATGTANEDDAVVVSLLGHSVSRSS